MACCLRRTTVQHQGRLRTIVKSTVPATIACGVLARYGLAGSGEKEAALSAGKSDSVYSRAPAGELPTLREINIEGYQGAVLPNGRLITPLGAEVNIDAPKPFGMALSADGKTLATINSGASRFSVTLIRNPADPNPQASRLNLNATFLGIAFSPDGSRFYASGGENGNIWVGDTTTGSIIGSVNLNGASHPLDRPLNVVNNPTQRFKGSFPGGTTLSSDGRYLYIVDQGGFQVHVIDTSKIETGTDADNNVKETDNFPAVVGHVTVGRYPFGIALSPDDKTLFVTH